MTIAPPEQIETVLQFLNAVYGPFAMNGKWPLTVKIRIDTRGLGRLDDLCRLVGPQIVICKDGSPDAVCRIDLRALVVLPARMRLALPGAELDAANVTRAIKYCVKKFIEADGKNVRISAEEFVTTLHMSAVEARRVALLLRDTGGQVWGGGSVGNDDHWASFNVNPNALEFEHIQSLRDYFKIVDARTPPRPAWNALHASVRRGTAAKRQQSASPKKRTKPALLPATVVGPTTSTTGIELAGRRLHARIAAVAVPLYNNGHHADAVFSASKALIQHVQELSGRQDLDGAALMEMVFSPKKPILAVNDLVAVTDRDEQLGWMGIMKGAVLALRNPAAHAFPKLSPELAIEYLSFLSLLATRASEARKVGPSGPIGD